MLDSDQLTSRCSSPRFARQLIGQRRWAAYVAQLFERYPDLLADIASALASEGRADLGEQLRPSGIASVTYDNSADAGYIYLQPTRELNAVECNIVGPKHGETIQVECAYWCMLDVDNFGRITGVELLSPPADIKSKLREDAAQQGVEPGVK